MKGALTAVLEAILSIEIGSSLYEQGRSTAANEDGKPGGGWDDTPAGPNDLR